MIFLNFVKDFFLGVFTLDISIYIVSAWAVVALFCLIVNFLSGRTVIRK